ncbi:MAG TPA: hypothetical protein PK890_04770, partial [Terrimesophilobacter sp.]|nr:hypothetical protein [Terrimesophilobacter sp.]
MSRITPLLAVPALLVGLLSACSVGAPTVPGDPAETSGPAPEPGSSTTDTGCLLNKTWHLDIDDMAEQLALEFTNLGMPVVDLDGFGNHRLEFTEEGLATSTVDVTFDLLLAPESAPTSTTRLRQFGSAYGDWAWLAGSESIGFSNWVSDVKLEMAIEVGGVFQNPIATDLPITDMSGSD